jgi:reactive chlorine resistance protein C
MRAINHDRIDTIGIGVLRYGLVALILLWGAFKFFEFEAVAIQPLVDHSPFLGWMYPLLGVRGTSAVFGVFEVPIALLIATRHWFPRLSGYASLIASTMFLVTISFLFTTPGVFAGPFGGFLMKDVILLGAALVTSAEALRAARRAES